MCWKNYLTASSGKTRGSPSIQSIFSNIKVEIWHINNCESLYDLEYFEKLVVLVTLLYFLQKKNILKLEESMLINDGKILVWNIIINSPIMKIAQDISQHSSEVPIYVRLLPHNLWVYQYNPCIIYTRNLETQNISSISMCAP